MSRVPLPWMRWYTVADAVFAGVVKVAAASVQAVAAGRLRSQIHDVTPAVDRTSATNNVVNVDRYQSRNV